MTSAQPDKETEANRTDSAMYKPATRGTVEKQLDNPVDGAYFEPIDPVEERKLVRKLDMVILPLMALVYFFQYLDKSSINYAAVFGLREDLSLTGDDFSWVVSLFYFGQLCSEYPAMYLLSRFRVSTFVAGTIIAWGAVEMAIGGTQNFHGVAAARFFLGFTEAAVSPAFIIITSLWYRRREHPMRVAAWVSMNGISQIVGALLMYAVGGANMSIESWRAIFLIFGGCTVACGILFLFLMPKDTTTAWFLTAAEKDLATRRLAVDRATRDRSDFNKAQMWEALKSPLTWMYFFFALCITLTSPILKFSSLVINGFGYSKFRTMLLGTPGGALSFVFVWISALGPRIFPNARIYTMILLALIPLAGSLILLFVPVQENGQGSAWTIVVATWLAALSSPPLSGAAALVASNVKGNTKKSVVSAGFFISYCICLIISLIVYLFTVKAINKARDAEGEESQVDSLAHGVATGLSIDSDLTDVQDKGFRYST